MLGDIYCCSDHRETLVVDLKYRESGPQLRKVANNKTGKYFQFSTLFFFVLYCLFSFI